MQCAAQRIIIYYFSLGELPSTAQPSCFDVVIIVTVAVVVVVSTAFQFSVVSNLLFLFCFYHLFVSSKVTIKQLVMMNAGPTHQPTNSMAR